MKNETLKSGTWETSLYNSDVQHGPEFNCNYQALPDRSHGLLTDINAFQNYLHNLFEFFLNYTKLQQRLTQGRANEFSKTILPVGREPRTSGFLL